MKGSGKAEETEVTATKVRVSGWWVGCPLVLMSMIAILFFMLNRWQPLASDDYVYSFIYSQPGRVESCWDILVSQWYHWNLWSGRYAVHCIAQFFLMHDKLLFDIANTLALLGVAFGVTWFTCEHTKPGKIAVAAATLALLVLFTPQPGTTLVWLDGSCGYLWSFLLVAGFLVCAFSPGRKLQLAALLLAPLAGNAHEGLAVGLLVYMFVYTCLTAKKQKYSLLYYSALVLLVLGAMLNLLSPGMRSRYSVSSAALQESGLLSLIEGVTRSTWALIHETCSYKLKGAYTPSLFMVACGMGIWLFRWKKCAEERNIKALSLLLAGIIQGAAVMSSGVIYSRAMFGFFFFSLLAILVYAAPLVQNSGKWWRTGICAFFCTWALLALFRSVPGAIENRACAEYIVAQAKAQQRIIVRPEKKHASGDNGYYSDVFSAFGFMANCLRSERAAQYYGVKPFSTFTRAQYELYRTIPAETISRIEQGDIMLLPEGHMLLSVPSETGQLRVACSVVSESAEACETIIYPHLVWPLGEKYGVLFMPPTGSTQLHIAVRLKDDSLRYIHITEAQLSMLKKGSALPREQVILHEGEVTYLPPNP